MAVSILGPQVIPRLVAVIPFPWSRCQVTATLPSIVSCVLVQILVAHVLLILLTRPRGGMLGLIRSLCPTRGGGNRSTRRTKTCTLGTESPNQEDGDAKWHSLIFSKLSTLLGRFTFRQYLRLQQKSLAAHGNRLQTEDFGVHKTHMVRLVDKIQSRSTSLISQEDSGTPITVGITTLLDIGIARKCLRARLTPVLNLAWVSGIERTQRTLFQQSRHTVLVIVGSESPSLLAVA